MLETIRNKLKNDDFAVSAVIGTILMIAVTVVLGGVIYAAIGGFGSKDLGAQQDPSVFRAIGIDTDNDGKTDSIQLTYFSGPANIDSVARVNGQNVCATAGVSDLRSAGDACRVDALPPNADGDDTLAFGNHQVVVIVNGKVALDTTVALQE